MTPIVPTKFKGLRVKTDGNDAVRTILDVEHAMRRHGASVDEVVEFRTQCQVADDPISVARKWVDIC